MPGLFLRGTTILLLLWAVAGAPVCGYAEPVHHAPTNDAVVTVPDGNATESLEEVATELERGLREIYAVIIKSYEHGSLDPLPLKGFIDWCPKLSPYTVTENDLLLSLATIHFRRGEWGTALSLYEQADRKGHDLHPFMLWRRSQCLLALDRKAESLVLLGQLIDDGPPPPLRDDIHLAYAKICIGLGITEKKDSRLKRIVNVHRTDHVHVEIELERARHFFATKDRVGSLNVLYELMNRKRIDRLTIDMTDLLRRIETRDGRENVYNTGERMRQAAAFYMRIGEFSLAESLLRSYREKYPNTRYALEVLRNWADSLYRSERYEEAVAAYGDALTQVKALKDKLWISRRIARCHQLKGEYQRAIDLYDAVISQAPRTGDARLAAFSAAFCEEMLGRWEDARRRYQDLVQPMTGKVDREEASFRLAMLEYVSGDTLKAREVIEALSGEKKLVHREEDSLFWSGKLQLFTGDAQAAIATFTTFLGQYPVSAYRPLVEGWLNDDERLAAFRLLEAERLAVEVEGHDAGDTTDSPGPADEGSSPPAAPVSEGEDHLFRLINGKLYPQPPLRFCRDTSASAASADDSSTRATADRLRFHFDYELALRYYREHQRRNLQDVPLMLTLIHFYLLIDRPYDGLYFADTLRGLFGGTIDWQRIPLHIRRYFFPVPWKDTVQREAVKNGIEPAIIAAIIRQESRFNQSAVSGAGARGLMQIMPETGRNIARQLDIDEYQPEMLFDRDRNIAFGTWYIAGLMAHFDNSLPEALAGYNAGRKSVGSWMSILNARQEKTNDISDIIACVRFRETRGYIKLILTNLENYRQLAE